MANGHRMQLQQRQTPPPESSLRVHPFELRASRRRGKPQASMRSRLTLLGKCLVPMLSSEADEN